MLSPILDLLETTHPNEGSLSTASMPPQRVRLEDKKELLWQAVALADSLVSQLKSHYKVRQSTNEVSM